MIPGARCIVGCPLYFWAPAVLLQPPTVSSGAHYSAGLPLRLHTQSTTVLPGSRCTAGLPLYCRTSAVLPGTCCTAGLPLYCRAPAVLLGSRSTAGLPLYCRDPAVLPGSRCTVGLPLYCRASAPYTTPAPSASDKPQSACLPWWSDGQMTRLCPV